MSVWTITGIVITLFGLLAIWAANGVRYYDKKNAGTHNSGN